jgi:hypothetical protein
MKVKIFYHYGIYNKFQNNIKIINMIDYLISKNLSQKLDTFVNIIKDNKIMFNNNSYRNYLYFLIFKMDLVYLNRKIYQDCLCL